MGISFIELNTKAEDVPIEILGYNIDYKKMNEKAWKSNKDFYREYMSNPSTPLYVEMDDSEVKKKKLTTEYNDIFMNKIYNNKKFKEQV